MDAPQPPSHVSCSEGSKPAGAAKPSEREQVLPSDEKLFVARKLSHRTIVRPPGSLTAQQFAMDSLTHCTVKLFGPMDSVRVGVGVGVGVVTTFSALRLALSNPLLCAY